MAEMDHQVALLLQHQFEQEAKTPKEHKFDVELAKSLQDQFLTEDEIDNPKNGLVYKAGSSTLNSSKCLVDPSWEVIDSTPDVHVLFMALNKRFFWNKLLDVRVSWSKRMTSSAGVCSYQRSRGLCSITLSEPLLKLRPRRDLVETLLHEMIHAYIFVTNNDKDRSGHGPEFQKHMYRINKESGTNITVYHDFYNEVNLYKQHWWQCNGPCKNQRPYFGMVRRALNRAPGPKETWWVEHSRTCGGTFVKVREPKKQTEPTKENVKPKKDIRKYIPTEVPHKIPKIDVSDSPSGHFEVQKTTDCPVCLEPIPVRVFDTHIDLCLEKPKTKECIICALKVVVAEYEIHVGKCSEEKFDNEPSAELKFCSICQKEVAPEEYVAHVKKCQNKFYVGMEEVARNERVDCLTCGKNIPRSELSLHLDDCSAFTDRLVMGEEEDVGEEGVKYNCPLCFMLLTEKELKTHIDSCTEKEILFQDEF